MLLLTLLLACQPVDGNWDTLFEPVSVDAPEVEATPAEDPAFAEAREREAAAEDPWGEEDPAVDEEPDAPEAEPTDTGAPEPVAEVEPIQAGPIQAGPARPVIYGGPPPDAPPPVGLPDQPAWGVRLLGTLPQAVPPRAALGLPDGRELVVSPGTMLADVGVVVVAVGPGTVQLARVTPAGDHARIEPLVLHAQYGGMGASDRVP
ncbi:MAG: hypothetical protein H6739_30750 [Alphaproteobacteria bacterium]|nr:hypothetical protein [Alphaproteobacteria bacterium]